MMLSLSSVIVATVMVLGQVATTSEQSTESIAKEDLAKLQGQWEIKGPAVRSVKTVSGNKETIARYNSSGELFHEHVCDFKLDARGGVRLFTLISYEVTEGENKGQKSPPDVSFSYIYAFGENTLFEARGLLVGQDDGEPRLVTWTRVNESR